MERAIVGKRVVFTGALSMSRDVIVRMVHTSGGIPQGRITKDTDFLVIGRRPGASKTKDAQEAGVEIIGERDFARMFRPPREEKQEPPKSHQVKEEPPRETRPVITIERKARRQWT